jgi:predicted acyl esterase
VDFRLRSGFAAFEHRFDRDTELSGPMTLRLRVATRGAEDPRLFVGIEKLSGGEVVPFHGSYGYVRDRVARGWLRLALRDLDPELSTPHEPVHGFRALKQVCDGKELDVVIPLTASATLFRAGESLRLLVAGRYLEPRNPFFGHFPVHYRPSTGGEATILWGPGIPSSLEIPVIPPGRA